jgi:hypothetical protein
MLAIRNHLALLVCCVSSAMAACFSVPGSAQELDLAARGNPIVGGAADPTDTAVMSLLHSDQMGTQVAVEACTGTTIAKQGASGIFLTAAHCVVHFSSPGVVAVPIVPADPATLAILPGADYLVSYNQGLLFGVVDVKVHPQYNGDATSPYDLAVLRYVGATDAMPVIPALSPAEDTLAKGSTITLVGYGTTETNAQNTQRRKVDKVIDVLSSLSIQYQQTDGKGGCEGDSGGPGLLQTPNGLRVAAVTSGGDMACTQFGISVRVSSLYAFVQAFIDAAPKTLDCGECSLASAAPDNACFPLEVACRGGSSPCGQFITCLTPCTTAACVNDCRARNSKGALDYFAVAKCQCSGMCSSACSADPSCGAGRCGGWIDSRPLCGTCIRQKCCAEAQACTDDISCAGCSLGHPCPTNEPYLKLSACLATCDANPCNVSAPVGVPADAGPDPAADGGVPPTDDGATPGSAMLAASTSAGCSCRVEGSPDRDRAPLLSALACAAVIALRKRRRPASVSA